MGLMDTRYPAYEVVAGEGGKPMYMLYRLEADRSKGLVIRENSRMGLFGPVKEVMQIKGCQRLNKGQRSSAGIIAETDLYLELTDENGKKTLFRFTEKGHINAIEKYAARQQGR